MYLKLAENIGRSFNVIIGDSSHAVALEIILNDSLRTNSDKIVVKTNYFTELKKYNINKEKTRRSEARLEKIMKLLPAVNNGQDLISMLGSHSEDNDYENICRHDKSETVASAIFEIKGGRTKAYYLLNDFPHNKKFKEKIVLF